VSGAGVGKGGVAVFRVFAVAAALGAAGLAAVFGFGRVVA
jgi:hypothetical protein